MNWLNLKVSIVRAPEYVGCDPVQRATWLNVLAYCAEQENGGVIAGGRQWKDRQWQQTCGVTLKEIESAEPLLQWDGAQLVVWGYPTEKESEVRENRKNGALGGSSTSLAKAEAARMNGQKGGRPKVQKEPNETQQGEPTGTEAITHQKPTGELSKTHQPSYNRVNPSENPTERKGKEGERKGKEELVRALHESYHALTGYPATLSPDRMRAWGDFIDHGYTDGDMKRVIHFIRKGMNDGGKFDERSLQFSVLIGDLGKFEERLLMAKKAPLLPTVKKVANPDDVYRVPANGSE